MKTFWSSTTDKSVITHFAGTVFYYILPNPSRSSWNSRGAANDFSTSPYQHEWLYPALSRFQVQSAACVYDPAKGTNMWNVTLMELDTLQVRVRGWMRV